ncbi:hypothetical protein HMSSN036_01780 [Paenibacillus macerans]|nr:hypothetical protein HMSSN036_01780 [Paenibacillus macerans]
MNEQVLSPQPDGRGKSAARPISGYAGRILARTVMWLFLLITAMLTLFPLLMTLSGSLKTAPK